MNGGAVHPALMLPPVLTGEAAMLNPLLDWLARTGRLRNRTLAAVEVPWKGRRIDLALVTARGVTSAYELKVGSLQRALEQAAYNASAFHRSWVVTANRPQADGIRWARSLGVGIIVIQSAVVVVVRPEDKSPPPDVARRVRAAVSGRAIAVS